MSEQLASFSDRLVEAMNNRGITAKELSEKTGIGQSSISHYVSGRYRPTNDRVFLFADSLSVSPEWLMGFDVPMDVKEFHEHKMAERIAIYTAKLLKLDAEDQDFIFRQIDLLSKN